MTIIVCPLHHVEQVVERRGPSHMITLLDPSHDLKTPSSLLGRHLRVDVNDIVEASQGLILADEAMIRGLIEFGAGWDTVAPLLVHCWAGISRSTATAFILACERNPDVDEAQIAATLRHASPTAQPNRRFVSVADDLLGRRGRMVDAVSRMSQARYDDEGRPFDLPITYPGAGRSP